ncbi:enoyl-CoA hydratase/isomerase family protein [Zavarzinia compransoris]|uniref:Enoyl-CoA hydratase n=1 Tax=Zavarzinia compransoris TaxID=1264899 RepID=A0A317E6V9_9PROT|nr:enoyl-CoA hydratase-related protein [Zavarzinia compransoris]PWR22010.1 hypothetical protein DKG75_08505 [Zavarzinia compransoris]TDP47251.1 short chain enoyl-CoA hydratase /enoyl-CoA hydratase [Zavarzinia compransoris]
MTILYDQPAAGVAVITLNRPDALNSLDGSLRRDLQAALMRAGHDKAVRAVVLTGAGRAFCSGTDLREVHEEKTIEDLVNVEYGGLLESIATMNKPVIAAVNGLATGIGVAFALVSDLVVMGEDAYFCSVFSNIGLLPDGGLSVLLVRQLGYHRAYQLAIEAERIPAARCLELGLANRIAAPDAVAAEAIAWAGRLAERAPLALGLTKQSFRAAALNTLREGIALEAKLQDRAAASADFKEGVRALFEKRRPVFTGA